MISFVTLGNSGVPTLLFFYRFLSLSFAFRLFLFVRG